MNPIPADIQEKIPNATAFACRKCGCDLDFAKSVGCEVCRPVARALNEERERAKAEDGTCPDHRATAQQLDPLCSICLLREVNQLKAKLTAAQADLAKAKEDSERLGWQPIETAPKHTGVFVLVYVPKNDAVFAACFDGEHWRSGIFGLYPPSLWMPFPDKPSAARTKGQP